MKKTILNSLFLLSFILGYGQELPTRAPVSPEAASIGKYGDLPVNLSTGRINYTIPIYTIKEGDIELPIYLSYNHTGLLAEEDPGLVGLGWSLHAGGMIVRQLRGIPDENGLGYLGGNIGKDLVVPFVYNQWNGSSESEIREKMFNLLEGAQSGRLDTKPDKFVVNAGDLTGNFFYNELRKAIFQPQKNYQVSWNTDGFVIQNDNGIKYSFNEKQNTESELKVFGAEEANNPPMKYVSGWSLTKIESPITNSNIVIEYDHGAGYSKTFYSESTRQVENKSGSSSKCVIPVSNLERSLVDTHLYGKAVSKISFSQGTLVFDIRGVPNGSQSKSSYLHSIELRNKSGDVINKYEFVYDNLLSNFKLLKEIKKFGQNNSQIPFFKFGYKGTPPTNIKYSSQDSWGYYNGKHNDHLIRGDRKVDFEKSSLGALTKITYPSQGYTQINYEANKVTSLENEFVTAGQCFTTPINKKESISAKSYSDTSVSKTILIKTDQRIKVTLSVHANSDRYDNYTSGFAEAIASIGKASEGEIYCDSMDQCNNDGCSEIIFASIEGEGNIVAPNKIQTSYHNVKANTLLQISASVQTSNKASATSSVYIEYFDPDIVNPNNTTSNNIAIDVGGIRVSSTTDCTSDNKCIAKNYKYILENGSSSGEILTTPNYSHKYHHSDRRGSCTIVQSSSQSNIPLASFQGAPVLYSRVEILNNNDVTKGKTVKYFSFRNNPKAKFPFAPWSNKDWRKGKLLREEVYKYESNNLFLIKSIDNEYDKYYPFPSGLSQTERSIGLAVGRIRNIFVNVNGPDGVVEALSQGIGDYKYDDYYNRPESYHLKTSITKEFLDGKELVSINKINYTNNTGYIDKQLQTNSNGDVITRKYVYPSSGTLKSQNRIAMPVKTSTIKKTGEIITKLNEQNTVYDDFEGLYLPEKIQSSKGDQQLEDKVIYHNYDHKGNPVEVSKANGIRIVYLWGYNYTQPVAKIENATYAEVMDVLDKETDDDLSYLQSFTEREIQAEIQKIRTGLSKSQVTTYTHIPLVGVSTITDPRGEKITYHYDDFNRLEFVKDSQGNILKEHQYKYKN